MTQDNAENEAKLLPCPNPWCEGEQRGHNFAPAVRLHHFGDYRVVCTSCILEGPLRATRAEAITAWNTRAQLSPLSGEVEIVARALYAARPFCMASTATTFGAQLAQTFDWDGAPAYYQADMIDLARAAIAALESKTHG